MRKRSSYIWTGALAAGLLFVVSTSLRAAPEDVYKRTFDKPDSLSGWSGDVKHWKVGLQGLTATKISNISGGEDLENYALEVTLNTGNFVSRVPPWDNTGIFVRYTHYSNTYSLRLSRTYSYVSITRVKDNERTLLAGHHYSFRKGREYKIRFVVFGDRLRVYINGEPEFQISDDALSHGRFALRTGPDKNLESVRFISVRQTEITSLPSDIGKTPATEPLLAKKTILVDGFEYGIEWGKYEKKDYGMELKVVESVDTPSRKGKAAQFVVVRTSNIREGAGGYFITNISHQKVDKAMKAGCNAISLFAKGDGQVVGIQPVLLAKDKKGDVVAYRSNDVKYIRKEWHRIVIPFSEFVRENNVVIPANIVAMRFEDTHRVEQLNDGKKTLLVDDIEFVKIQE